MTPETNTEGEPGFNEQPLTVGHLRRESKRRGRGCVVRVTEHSLLREADDVIRGIILRQRRGPEVLQVSADQLRRFEPQVDLYRGLEDSAREAGMAVIRIRSVDAGDADGLLERGYFPLRKDVSMWEKPLARLDEVNRRIDAA